MGYLPKLEDIITLEAIAAMDGRVVAWLKQAGIEVALEAMGDPGIPDDELRFRQGVCSCLKELVALATGKAEVDLERIRELKMREIEKRARAVNTARLAGSAAPENTP